MFGEGCFFGGSIIGSYNGVVERKPKGVRLNFNQVQSTQKSKVEDVAGKIAKFTRVDIVQMMS